jgi:hypothetical protein
VRTKLKPCRDWRYDGTPAALTAAIGPVERGAGFLPRGAAARCRNNRAETGVSARAYFQCEATFRRSRSANWPLAMGLLK